VRIIPRLPAKPLRFYVASRLANAPEVSRLIRALEWWGWVCTYDWTTEGIERAPMCLGVTGADLVICLLPGVDVEIGLALAARGAPRMILASADAIDFDASPFYGAKRIEHVLGGVDEVIALLDGE
jgi:hypothetical protein